MKVTIEQKQLSTGFLIKKTVYLVKCAVEFNQEERDAIQDNKLLRFVLYTDDTDPYGNPAAEYARTGVTVRHWTKGQCQGRYFNNMNQAREWETALREKILPGLKKLIDIGTTKDTFEL
jgi:hypothetical protein